MMETKLFASENELDVFTHTNIPTIPITLNSVSIRIIFSNAIHLSEECYSTNSAIYFQLVEFRKFLILLHDDIISVEEITNNDFTESEKLPNIYLEIIAYPIISGKRQRLQIRFNFSDKSLAECWKAYISKKIDPPLPPHFQRKISRKRKILVLVNPFGGQKNAKKIWQNYIARIFQESHIDYDLIVTEREKHAIEIARCMDLDEYDAVAVISGDGLINEIISGLLLRPDRIRAMKFPIAHIPGGTSNALAASICFQCNEPFSPRKPFFLEAALMICRPRYLPLRICSVQTEKDGDRPMFLSVTWGLLADIDIGSERFRWAGLARLHIEAFLRIMRLPSVARYKARLSFVPVHDDSLKLSSRLRHHIARKAFGKDHFRYDEISHFSSENDINVNNSHVNDEKIPLLNEQIPEHWTSVEGEYVFVCITNLSHLGSDVPYIPSSRLDDDYFFLSYVDWKLVKSRFQIMQMMLEMCNSGHLDYSCFQVIPVKACRVEPKDGCGGYLSIDGEPISPGTTFQVVPFGCVTIVGRNEVKSAHST